MHKRKFLFLIAPSISREVMFNSTNKANRIDLNPPYGPLSIIAYVKNYAKINVDFEILDLKLLAYDLLKNNKKEEDLVELVVLKIKEFAPDFIGISALFSLCYSHLYWLEEAILTSGSQAITLIGGALATGSYHDIFSNFQRIDMVSYGEGEVSISMLVGAENPMGCYRQNPSIVTRKSLAKGYKPQPQYLQHLDDIPPYDFSYIDLDKYSGVQYYDGKFEGKSIEIISSRGCPFNCVFCSCHLMYGKKVRFHSAKRICQQIQRYVSMGYKTIRFYDENFFFNEKHSKAILHYMACLDNPEISLEFPNGMMTAKIDEVMAQYLRKAGLKKANLAVESGSEYVLKKIIEKPVTKQQVIRAVNALRANDIEIILYLVTGFPGENCKHRQETIDFVKSLHVDWAQVLIATPFKGSRLYEICVKNNYLYNYDISKISMRECYIKTPEYSPKYIEYVAYKMNLQLNFVENSNIKCGEYNRALGWFIDIIGKFPYHAFAHYCASYCYESMKQLEKSKFHLKQFNKIIAKDQFWEKYATEFNLVKHNH